MTIPSTSGRSSRNARKATVKFTQHVSKPITIFYDFTYRHVGVSNLKIDPLLLPQLAQSVRVGIAEINLVQDRRDDPLDPHKGIYNTLNVGLATKAFGSQTSFARILGRNATYYRLGEKLVFARETQVGLQPAFSIPANAEAGRSRFPSPSVSSAAAAIRSADSRKTRRDRAIC